LKLADTIAGRILGWAAKPFAGGADSRGNPGDEVPLRAELFSADQMEQHGKTLAGIHQLTGEQGPDRLLPRLAENEAELLRVCNLLTAAVKGNRRITPASEWLLDNFHLIDDQIRTAKRHLPRHYSKALPRLTSGPSAGLPRVYDIALEAVAHGDGRLDAESLGRFVEAYQSVSTLKIGELWAIPIMLRLALIENLRRVASRILANRSNQDQANFWADQMMHTAENDPKSLILVIADMARSNPPLVSSFVSELARRLQGQSAALALPLTWIEQRLSESGSAIDQLVQSEAQNQAAAQVSISNSIGSLRFLAAMDWREFVETLSVVERKLREDPSGVYAKMDFATRDLYRHSVEEMAKHSSQAENDVARKAIQLAHEAAARGADGVAGGDARALHVGYYLIDKGLPGLEAAAEVKRPLGQSLRAFCLQIPLTLYLGGIGSLTVLFCAALLLAYGIEPIRGWRLAMLGALLLVCMSQLAVSLVNWLASVVAIPRALPRMDFEQGIPAESRTLVVVPSMLSNAHAVDELAESLEVRFLANRDPHLHFALLTDFSDAASETLPGDATLIELARAHIAGLNKKYPGSDGDIFFLFHRPRRWNAEENAWMGYERKRGKLGELNSLLRGGDRHHFQLVVGGTEVLSNVKYVITLDTDTQLPRDTARTLTGAISHPLNCARYDDAGLRVVAGYGILQPRVTASLPGTNRSRYAALCGSEPGIDPYTRAVSDVYQDLFGEGSFIGKGIYDVDAFERVLDDHFPENRILSHDLLEGCYARSGLLTDVEVYEDYPGRYSADSSRRHRWIRGDWQIAPWLRRKLPAKFAGPDQSATGKRANPLTGLSQWKIFDNLRRSVVPPALMLLLLLGWTVLGRPWLWTLAVLGVLLIPPAVAGITEVFRKPEDVLTGQHLLAIAGSARQRLVHAAFTLACLPYEAWYAVDAIVRTLARMYVTHKHLLQWTPSSEIEHKPQGSAAMELFRSYRSMLACPLAAGLTAAYLIARMGDAWLVAAPVLCIWFAAPAFTWWLSRPLTRRRPRLTAGQRQFLNRAARKTWAFFETFVSPAEHWLPPDNFQEHPVAVVAHRTSPTNVGMALLANLAAYDFGYISTGRLLQRTVETFNTLKILERYQGHFYNWYDTQSLKPLLPLYVSSVDSGNLAGNLLTLRAGLLALPDDRIFSPQVFEGLSDTARILTDIAAGAPGPALRQLSQMQRELESAYDSRPGTVSASRQWLERLAASASQVQGHFVDGSSAADNTDLPAMGAPDASPRWWANALVRQCQDALSELNLLAPWSSMPQPPRGLEEFAAMRMPTLRELATPEAERLPAIARAVEKATSDAQRDWLQTLQGHVMQAAEAAKSRTLALEQLAATAGEFAQMDYGFLYDVTRHLLAIGYNVTERRRDAGEYDLLASEARLTTYVCIAQSQFSQESWFAMGRQLTAVVGAPTLLSWSGSMFEYLMPLLIMPTYENSLLDQTCHSAVERQIVYGFQRGVPWGISESGYNAVDASLNYQYRAFGVPGLGLQRGLAEDLVIAPYASALALMIAPEQACLNLQRLASDGMEGPYGFYEAVDYTPARLPRGQTSVIVRSFMAHHQGMSLLALAYLRFDRPMQKRFEADPQLQATTLLLHERIPKATAYYTQAAEIADARAVSTGPEMPIHLVASADTPIPEVQLLSNGKYHVMVTNAGGGYSRWKDLAVTRWREDTTCDNWGSFCYVRDLASGEFWSNSHQPTLKQATTYEALFSEARAEFRRRDGDYDTHTEIVVSPEDDIELRRVRITNRSRSKKTIDVTSYAEVVLATPASDAMQPAFNNLFVQTEIMQQQRAIICTRRPRSEGEPAAWMFHLMAVHGAEVADVSYETDRMRFVGRGGSVESPAALNEAGALSGSQGSVLDPIVAIRYRITLEAEQTATVDMVTGIGDNRDTCVGLVGKYQDRNLAERVFDLAWTHSWVSLRQINATEADAQLYGRLASSVVYANAALRADASVLVKNRRGQSGLWGYAISGDLPIVLLQIGNLANIDLVRQLVQAHAYWRLKGLAVDLVIWNEDHAGYRQALQDQIMGLIAAGA
jgi:cyclic beta-1,2-glucan synthetase